MKKLMIVILLSIGTLGIVAVFHYYHLPLYEWTTPLIAIPIIYTGMHFRRAASIGISYALIICQSPLFLMDFSIALRKGADYTVGAIATMAAGVLLGRMMQRQKDNADAIGLTRSIAENLRQNTSSDSLYGQMEDLFRLHGKTGDVEVYLFDGRGELKLRGAEDAPPLPHGHLFYSVAERGEFFVSFNPCEDARLEQKAGGPQISHIAAFPIEYGGRPRGVIAVINTGIELFGRDNVSFLTTIKQAVEGVLEIEERNRAAVSHEIQRARIRDVFASYVSRTVAEEILRDPDKIDLGGKLQEVTVMFTEVMNFERLQYLVKPEMLISMLNEYFALAIDTVFEHNGTLDKFIGDNVMAFWGAPLPMDNCEERAVRCAMSLQEKINGMNASWKAAGKQTFHVSIGINSGRVVAGNIGSIRRMEYTIIGDTVNVAARIKALSTAKNIPILAGENTYGKVSHLFGTVAEFKAAVKGKTDEFTVYQLL